MSNGFRAYKKKSCQSRELKKFEDRKGKVLFRLITLIRSLLARLRVQALVQGPPVDQAWDVSPPRKAPS